MNYIRNLFGNRRKKSDQFMYSHYLVAFLDLLGQKERLREIEGILETDNPDGEKLKYVLKNTVGVIWHFRQSFEDFFTQYSNHRSSLKIPKSFRAYFDKVRGRSKLNLQSFSDSTIVWTPIHLKAESDYAQALNSIHGVLSAVGLLMPLYLSKKFPFRGGIDIEGGTVLTSGGNEIYGPALNCAYGLESKDAKYPRILVGSGFLDFIDHIATVPFHDQLIRNYCVAMAERCKGWIVKDDDGQSMVHFLGPSANDMIKNTPEITDFYREVLEPIGAFILECEEKYKDDEKLGPRYQCLKRYYKLHIDNWRN